MNGSCVPFPCQRASIQDSMANMDVDNDMRSLQSLGFSQNEFGSRGKGLKDLKENLVQNWALVE